MTTCKVRDGDHDIRRAEPLTGRLASRIPPVYEERAVDAGISAYQLVKRLEVVKVKRTKVLSFTRTLVISEAEMLPSVRPSGSLLLHMTK